MYCIVKPNGVKHPTISLTSEEAKETFMSRFPFSAWHNYYNAGYKVISIDESYFANKKLLYKNSMGVKTDIDTMTEEEVKNALKYLITKRKKELENTKEIF